MVAFLILFSRFYLRYNTEDIRTKKSNSDIIFNNFSFYTVYVINMITNHGTYSRTINYVIFLMRIIRKN